MAQEALKEKWTFGNAMDNFLAFIHTLHAEVKKLGGSWADIHRLATEDGLGTIKKIAALIIEDGKKLAENAANGLVTIVKAFDPAKFVGKSWKFSEEPGDRIEAPKAFDPKKVSLISALKPGESSVGGEDRRKRLLAMPGKRLGADAFLWYWENKSQIPEEWKDKVVTFDADVLVDPDGSRDVLFLYWDDGAWNWHALWLGRDFGAGDVSASLAD